MPAELRKSGIDVVGDVPWGTHFCHFYETKSDLIDILVPYFKAGLENNECCIWVVSDPLNAEEARSALGSSVPEMDRRMAAGDIDIVPHSQWYLHQGIFDLMQATGALSRRLVEALAKGYAGLRLNGNETWLTQKDWRCFSEYEVHLADLIARKRALILCTYPLTAITAAELFDVASAHQFAIARRLGTWEILELEKLNASLEAKVKERTTALAVANRELQREIAQRKEAEAALRRLSTHLLRSQEDEHRRLAQQLHDGAAQLLVGIGMNLAVVKESTNRLNRRARQAFSESAALVDRCLHEIRTSSFLLYPPELDRLELACVLRPYVEGFEKRSGIHVDLKVPSDLGPLPQDVKCALFRVVQECLTNVHRHSGSDTASIRLVRASSKVTLEVEDKGRGIQGSSSKGVGIASMRERVGELGGSLEVVSTDAGATIRAVIPLTGNSA